VHFDAIGDGTTETLDSAFPREFHSLLFEWDFGDPGSGTWSVSGKSKEHAVGAIAGHLYESPGTYTVTLRVTNPAGESDSVQQMVTVDHPDAVFAAVDTYCFANSGTPGGAGFEDCPVALASQHFVIGSGIADGFNQALDSAACDRRSLPKRCLFRRGDAWQVSADVGLAGGTTSLGLIDAFGPAAAPDPAISYEGGGQAFNINADGWTLANLDFSLSDSGGLAKLLNERGRTTLYAIDATQVGFGCFASQGTGAPTHSDRVALIDVSCQADPTASFGAGGFFRTERTLVMGVLFDNNYTGEFSFRTIHFPHSVLQHSRLMRPQEDSFNTRNVLQLRAWAGTANNVPGTPPTPTDTDFVIISDNVFSQDNEDSVVRTCQGNECANTSSTPELENVIIERNFFFFSTGGSGGAGGMTKAFWLQGGDITVRNNVVDLQGIIDSQGLQNLVQHAPNAIGSSNDDNIHVLNNTVYYDDSISTDGFRFCGGGSVGTGHLCYNNLAYLPNHSASEVVDDGGNWNSSHDLFASSDPFAAPVPGQEATQATDFQADPGAASVVDAGFDFGTSAPTVRLDHGIRCRPASAEWDIGAWEAGADTACLLLPEPDPALLILVGLLTAAGCARASRTAASRRR
jgi:PKD repeat protein